MADSTFWIVWRFSRSHPRFLLEVHDNHYIVLGTDIQSRLYIQLLFLWTSAVYLTNNGLFTIGPTWEFLYFLSHPARFIIYIYYITHSDSMNKWYFSWTTLAIKRNNHSNKILICLFNLFSHLGCNLTLKDSGNHLRQNQLLDNKKKKYISNLWIITCINKIIISTILVLWDGMVAFELPELQFWLGKYGFLKKYFYFIFLCYE